MVNHETRVRVYFIVRLSVKGSLARENIKNSSRIYRIGEFCNTREAR